MIKMKLEKSKKMEEFKNNLEGQGFSIGFIKKAIEYFIELEEEREIQEMATIEEVIDSYNRCSSFTCNALQSELNLRYFRKDLYKLFQYDTNNLMNFLDYFYDIEDFEIQILYVLYFEFYPQEEEEENK